MVKIYINEVDIKNPSTSHIVDGKSISGCILPDISVEYFSHETSQFYKSESVNPLIAALHYSFTNHFPVQITPDVIFNTILYSISAHIRHHPSLHSKLMKTQTPSIIIDGDIRHLHQYIVNQVYDEKYHHLFSQEMFLTTDSAGAIANTCAFLDPIEHYCDYELVTYCGIPYIDIKGSKQDWIQLSKITENLTTDFNLPPAYNDEVQQIILQFIRAFDGDIDREHWNNIYLYTGPNASGQQAGMNGWISRIFLHIKDGMNPFYAEPQQNQKDSTMYADLISLFDFPLGISTVEIHHDNQYKSLTAGLIGVTITPEEHLKPELGWMVHSSRAESQNKQPDKKLNHIMRLFRFIWKKILNQNS